jgi:phage-related baseplate assembly protein
MSQIPLSDLPEPQVIPNDYNGTLTRLKKHYEASTGHYPLVSDPETFVLEQVAYERELLVDDINREARENLLAFANEAMLDHLGASVDCERLPASRALTSLQLTLTSGHPAFVLEPGFTVRAVDGQSLFATTDPYPVAATATTITVVAQCHAPGPQANGFLPGEITEVVTGHPEVSAATNTELSQGGSEVEDDERYRQRIYLAPSKFSVAGPYDAYAYFALTANGAIKHVKVWSPVPNDIAICALMAGGESATDAIKQQIGAVLSDDKVRPLGDRITVEDAEQVEDSGTFTLEIFNDYKAQASAIEARFASALDSTLARWKEQLGRDIVPEALTGLGQRIQGVYRCTTSLALRALARNQNPVVSVTAINVVVSAEHSQGGL